MKGNYGESFVMEFRTIKGEVLGALVVAIVSPNQRVVGCRNRHKT